MLSLSRKQSQDAPRSPVKYPNQTFVKTEKGYFYIVNDAKRYRITSSRVLASWRPHRVVETTEAAVSRYRIAAKMKFRNGSLIWNLDDGKIYLIEDGTRRHVVSPDVFIRLGLDPSKTMKEVMWVSKDEISLHELGKELT